MRALRALRVSVSTADEKSRCLGGALASSTKLSGTAARTQKSLKASTQPTAEGAGQLSSAATKETEASLAFDRIAGNLKKQFKEKVRLLNNCFVQNLINWL